MELKPSELFGHKKGSFTSADWGQNSFAEANGGTLFLDEVGNLPYGVPELPSNCAALFTEKDWAVSTVLDDGMCGLLPPPAENLESHCRRKFQGRFVPSSQRVYDRSAAAEELQRRYSVVCHFVSETNAELDKKIKFISDGSFAVWKRLFLAGNLKSLHGTLIRRSVLFLPATPLPWRVLPFLSG